jgi:hypothetical protein
VEDALSYVNQKMQGLNKELTENIEETQVDLQAVKTSFGMGTRSLQGDITYTKKDFHKAVENTRNNLHKELEALEDHFGDYHLAAACCSQLKTRTQGVRILARIFHSHRTTCQLRLPHFTQGGRQAKRLQMV